MAKTQTISNEKIIAALLQHGTMKEAAAAIGTTPRTIYDRMKNADFRSEYMTAKTDIIRNAVLNINKRLSEAIDTVAEIMKSDEVNPATRLQAAQTIINNAGKLASRLSSDEYQSRTENEKDGFWNF